MAVDGVEVRGRRGATSVAPEDIGQYLTGRTELSGSGLFFQAGLLQLLQEAAVFV